MTDMYNIERSVLLNICKQLKTRVFSDLVKNNSIPLDIAIEIRGSILTKHRDLLKDEKYQILAARSYGNILKYIKNPSHNVIMEALLHDGHSLQHVKNQTEEYQRTAINTSPFAITYIKNPTKELQLYAVSKSIYAIYHIPNPDEEIQFKVLEKDDLIPSILSYIKEPTLNVQKYCLDKHISNFVRFKKYSIESLDRALSNDSFRKEYPSIINHIIGKEETESSILSFLFRHKDTTEQQKEKILKHKNCTNIASILLDKFNE